VLTLGVEEEFLLVGGDGRLVPAAPALLRRTRDDPRIKPEFLTYQLEIATSVCTGLDQLRTELTDLRLRVADAAAAVGARVLAVGAPPLDASLAGPLTHDQRYEDLRRQFPVASASSGTCACHVHVGVPDRRLAVEVVGRLRRWLPVLLAMTVNSPVRAGLDTRWGSVRYRLASAWPTFRPPDWWPSPEHYDREVRRVVRNGEALDPRGVYFLARLSPRYPTVEVRVADTNLTVEDSVLFAAIVRALVVTLIDDARRRRPPEPPVGPLDLDLLRAARWGLVRRPPAAGVMSSFAEAVPALHERILPALRTLADEETVAAGLERLERLGTGADRQRELRALVGSGPAFVERLVDEGLVVPRPS
jgi:carboxylate-amine ligase